MRALLCGVALACGLAFAAEAEAPRTPEEETRALSRRVLADPHDAAAVERLKQLRAQEGVRRREPIDALTAGLEAYLEGDFRKAVAELRKAAASPWVLETANQVLLNPVDEVIEDCAKRAAASQQGGGLCPECGGTGWEDCPMKSCYGAGTLLCPVCKGKGSGRPRGSTQTVLCPRCAGTGELRCKECNGAGVIRCARCGGKGAGGASWVGTNAAEAIHKTLTRMRYLRDGGIGLFSPEALECAPKLEK